MKKITLLGISAFILNFNGYAMNGTSIKIAQVSEPVNVGIFRGICTHLNLTKLKATKDFNSIATKNCQLVIDKTMNPNKPKDSLKAWHAGPSLTLVAFQNGLAPVQCAIETNYKTMFILGGNELRCTSPQAVNTTGEDDANEPDDPNLEQVSLESDLEE